MKNSRVVLSYFSHIPLKYFSNGVEKKSSVLTCRKEIRHFVCIKDLKKSVKSHTKILKVFFSTNHFFPFSSSSTWIFFHSHLFQINITEWKSSLKIIEKMFIFVLFSNFTEILDFLSFFVVLEESFEFHVILENFVIYQPTQTQPPTSKIARTEIKKKFDEMTRVRKVYHELFLVFNKGRKREIKWSGIWNLFWCPEVEIISECKSAAISIDDNQEK